VVVTTSNPLATREVKIPATRYSLYEQMYAATECFQRNAEAIQRQLKNLGYDSELVPVDVLDSLVGLSLSVQNVEERILRACKFKLNEPGTECVRLSFRESDKANDLIIEKDTTVEVLKQALALIRAKGYDRISMWRC
jgi:hypothetical protein